MGDRVPNVSRERTCARRHEPRSISPGCTSVSIGRMAAGSGWLERARMCSTEWGPASSGDTSNWPRWRVSRTDIDDLLASADRALAIALEFGDADLEAHRWQTRSGPGDAGRVAEGLARLDAALAAISTGEVGPIAAGICFCSMLTACDRTGDIRRAQEWTGISRR